MNLGTSGSRLNTRTLPLLVALLLTAACSSPPPRPCPYQGEPDYAPSAGCLTVVHGKMLVVDSRGGGLTPPGGKSREGESAQCTAHRETLEEIGLDLIPRELIWVFDTGFHLYSCEIHAQSGFLDPELMEVRRGLWLDVSQFESVKWRYEGQGRILREILLSPSGEPKALSSAD